ncbi:MAG: hypothetical protein AAGH99_05295 [Planctomycetota bacterium]
MSTGSAPRRSTKGRSKYVEMDASMFKRVKELEVENTRLKKTYADSQLEHYAMKQALAQEW